MDTVIHGLEFDCQRLAVALCVYASVNNVCVMAGVEEVEMFVSDCR